MERRDINYLYIKMEKEKQNAKSLGISKDSPSAVRIVRIMQTDIPAEKQLYPGLTRIKGVSWAVSNAVCLKLTLDKKRKINSLSKEEIEKIQSFLVNMDLPEYMLNRKKDFETGESSHLVGNDLDFTNEMDIRRLKKIRSYRGLRHALGLPSRGQSTKSHFRKNRKRSVGIKAKKKK